MLKIYFLSIFTIIWGLTPFLATANEAFTEYDDKGHYYIKTLESVTLDHQGFYATAIEITEDISSILLSFESTTVIQISSLVAPDGDVLVSTTPDLNLIPEEMGSDLSFLDEFSPGYQVRLSKNPIVTRYEAKMATALVPNNPEVELKAGNYKLIINALNNTAGPLSGYIVLKKKTNAATQTMKLALHFTGKLTADLAKTNKRFQSVLTAFKGIYQNAGIGVSDIQYKDLKTPNADIGCTERGDLDGTQFELSLDVKEKDAVNVVFIDSFKDRCQAIGGLSAGIPGVFAGSKASIVIMPVNVVRPDGTEYTIENFTVSFIHEVGHFLGLLHTTDLLEFEDPIPDTASDDYENPMYWMTAKSITNFTPQQSEILKNHPLVFPR